jgi:heme O synthase-like polyprenyltransferase
LPLSLGIAGTKRCIVWSAASLAPAGLLLWAIGPCSAGLALWTLILALSFLTTCLICLRAGYNSPAAFRASILYLLMVLTGIIVDLV